MAALLAPSSQRLPPILDLIHRATQPHSPNLLTLGNNDANTYYLTRCAEEKSKPQPSIPTAQAVPSGALIPISALCPPSSSTT